MRPRRIEEDFCGLVPEPETHDMPELPPMADEPHEEDHRNALQRKTEPAYSHSRSSCFVAPGDEGDEADVSRQEMHSTLPSLPHALGDAERPSDTISCHSGASDLSARERRRAKARTSPAQGRNWTSAGSDDSNASTPRARLPPLDRGFTGSMPLRVDGTPLPVPPCVLTSSRAGRRSRTSHSGGGASASDTPRSRKNSMASAAMQAGSQASARLISKRSCSSIASYLSSLSSGVEEHIIATTANFLSVNDRSLIRGMPLTRAMHTCGSMFGSAVGSEKTYSLSETVDEIDCFLSHNWSTPRVQKFWALAFHYNLGKAVLVTLLGGAIGAWMTAKGVFPYFVMADESSMHKFPRGLTSIVLGSVLFWMTLLMGHELQHYLVAWCPFVPRGLQPKMVFLDKTCIHQTDEVVKQRGIWSLGAFLVMSKKMVILYSHKYFKRIWTVYELACFLCMKKTDDCLFLACNAPQFVASGWLSVFLYFIATTILRALVGDVEATRFITVVICISSAAGTICVRSWHREMERLRTTLRTFALDEADCYDEKDRTVIYSGIISFMKYRGFCTADSDDRVALNVFEELLRYSMCDKIQCIVGVLGVQYEQTLIVGLPLLLVAFDTLGAKLARQDPVFETVICCSYYAVEYLLAFPVALALLFFMAKQCLGSQSLAREVIVGGCCVVGFVAERVATDYGHIRLVAAITEEESNGFFIGLYVLFILFFAFLCWLAYGTPMKLFTRFGLVRRTGVSPVEATRSTSSPLRPSTPVMSPLDSDLSGVSMVHPEATTREPSQAMEGVNSGSECLGLHSSSTGGGTRPNAVEHEVTRSSTGQPQNEDAVAHSVGSAQDAAAADAPPGPPAVLGGPLPAADGASPQETGADQSFSEEQVEACATVRSFTPS